MAQVHVHIPSFNAGELSPLLGARFAVEKVQAGCRLLRNFVIHTHGPAFRRPGLEDIGPAKSGASKSRLIGFSFSTTTGFVLEFNPDGLQVWSNGLLVTLANEVALPYSEAECQELQIEQVNDVCYIVHSNHYPRQLTRYANNDWRLTEIDWTWPPMGDENVRPNASATLIATTLLNVATELWPEFNLGPATYTFTAINPDSSSTSKTIKIQTWTGSAWLDSFSFTWTTGAPFGVSGSAYNFNWPFTYPARITYTGPVAVSGKFILAATGAPNPAQSNPTPIGFTVSLDTSISQPTSQKSVTVPIGDWQSVITCPASIPAGATLTIQKKTGATWGNFQTVTMTAGRTVETRQVALLAATDFRFIWAGRAMTGGRARIESLAAPSVVDVTMTVDGTSGTSRTMTASSAVFKAGHEGSFWQITHRRDNSTALINFTTTAVTSNEILVSGKWDVFSYGTWTTTLFLERKTGATWEIVRSWTGKSDRNIIASGDESEPAYLRLRTIAGSSSGTPAARFVLECADARVDGLVRVSAITSSTVATVDVVSGLYSTDPTAIWTEGAFSTARGFPRAVALHQGRLWFGGVIAEPTRLWGSVSNDYINFRRSSYDDGSISVTPASQRSNVVQWLTSFEQSLIIGTKGDEWTLSASGGTIKPTDLEMLRRSSYGSSDLQAIGVGDAMVFVQRGGKRVRQISPRSDAQQWSAVDLTVLAEHVGFNGFVCAAMMAAPQVILWMVTGDGKLLGMTFEREQNVFGWHVHETDGMVESVAVIAGPDADELWVSVLRANGRRIERMDSVTLGRDFSAPNRCMYLDSAKRIEGAPATVVTGLDHLEGRTVSALADGVVRSGLVVTGGQITLPAAAAVVVVGLPFTSKLQPMRLDIPLRDGTAQHRQWRTSRVGLYVHQSKGGKIGDAPNARLDSLEYSSGSGLYSGELEQGIESISRPGVDVYIEQSDPLPMNVGSITVKGDVYGE